MVCVVIGGKLWLPKRSNPPGRWSQRKMKDQSNLGQARTLAMIKMLLPTLMLRHASLQLVLRSLEGIVLLVSANVGIGTSAPEL